MSKHILWERKNIDAFLVMVVFAPLHLCDLRAVYVCLVVHPLMECDKMTWASDVELHQPES